MPVDPDLARHVVPENFLAPCLLLLLRESRATSECSAERREHRPYELMRAGEERQRDAAAERKATYTILDSLLLRCQAGSRAQAPPSSS